ncbi:MAG: biotin--[acetyl-CoA-carboxylase] ligase [bacterium]|nr:biotin--[acetyl-CoA-carboxylase] ligase [bacterium]
MSSTERILSSLARTPCSGEALSQELGVSRNQVWKHVQALRSRGYKIEGSPGEGYRLVSRPDRLYAEELLPDLATRWLARTLHHLETTDSTNRVAGELAREGTPHGTAVVAEHQSAGRGRLGRRFHSPAHQNLYVSLVLRPTIEITQAPTIILGAGLPVANTVAWAMGASERVEIKWPNDVLVDGLKVSGILMEMSAEATQVGHLVLGIGVNLNVSPATFPEEFRARATSLAAALGRPIDRTGFTRQLFVTLEAVLDQHAEAGFERLRSDFESFYRMRGREIEVSDPSGDVRVGVAGGVGSDGTLELRLPDGDLHRVIAGDVTLRPSAERAADDARWPQGNAG